MRVAVVGAGIAGLAAARRLIDEGRDVVVFEKSVGVGGRVATRRIGDYTFDHGATSIAPRGKRIEAMMLGRLSQEGLVRIAQPIYVHAFGRVQPGEATKMVIERYAYQLGNTHLAKRLAEGVDVRLNTRVEALVSGKNGYGVAGEIFDAVILTPPIPQSAELLAGIGEQRGFSNVRYRPCISVMMGFAADVGPKPYHAILDPEQRHPLTWLSIESIKVPGRAPEGHTAMVAQLSPQYSAEHYDAPDERVIADAVGYVQRFYGSDFAIPEVAEIKRWRYSQPETTGSFDSANRPGARVLVASDGLMGGRVEWAYEVGLRAAEALLTPVDAS